ncbi:MAG: putative zinc-binding metallopeptidase [Gemmatimonadetes bacterium]|nr:putative zinc-binding metallopeptidase [Gemmatimonadota bacterium]
MDDTTPLIRTADRSEPAWADLSDDQLLELRFCDLNLRLENSWLEDRIAQLNSELEACGITFRPHFWISNEWFTPDDVGGVAVPFYLAHPRLAKLEEAQLLEVEGGTIRWCMQILRHETGHAIDNAYRLRRRRKRQKLFGRSSTPYPEEYLPRPYSRSHVQHLAHWYAQSHPDEDFAETFAVWMTPGSNWRARYVDWPALRKLEYIDELMRRIGPTAPLETTRRRVDPIERLRRTLRTHYRRKRKHYGLDHLDFYDRDLRRLFTDAPEAARNPPAARFVQRIRREVRRRVAGWTGAYQYTIDQVLEDIIERCRELNLRLAGPEDQARIEFTILLTVQAMNYLHTGGYKVAL